jgi:hypothetical protein
MRFVVYSFYWLVLAPVILLATLRVLTTPAALLAKAIWPDQVPTAVSYALNGLAIFSFAVAIGAVVWVWARFRDSLKETLASGPSEGSG